MKALCLAGAAALALAAATPAAAQRSAAHFGNYSEVTDVEVLPGQFENYMDYLKREWVPQQQWAKSKGYITDYRIWVNVHARKGEPNLFLMTSFKDWPSQAESDRRNDEYVARMKMDEHQLESASGSRAPMRVIGSATLLQEVTLK